jgi:gliding motility-associated-like protein
MSPLPTRTAILALFIFFFASFGAKGQCELYDGLGVPSMTPQWISCFGTDFNLVVQSPNNLGAWTIDWGDGSPIEAGGSLIPPVSVPHNYTATINIYTVTFIETATGCTVIGTVIMEEPSNASIQIPFGGVTQACAPATLEFINSSTDVSTTTIFTWDFGDGSPIITYGDTNAGQTVQHQYLQGTVNCETFVTLTAENACNTSQGGPSIATFNPIRIWDLDDAAITPSATLLCYPDTVVTYDNTTNRNCLAQGNTFQRQEYWNFGDYWGLGYDSIIDWTPWPPTFPQTIAYPGLGTYTTMLIDSNFCGLDTAFVTINIVPPPTADFSIVDDTVCVAEDLTTVNLSAGGANDWWWNFGDGTGWQNTGNGNQAHQYGAPGDYTIQLVANILGGTVSCTDTIAYPVHVLPSPTAQIVIDNNNGCDTLTVGFTDGSIGAVQWAWDFGNGNNSIAQNPGNEFYPSSNNYNASLTVTSINGCIHSTSTTINVYQSPVVSFIPTSVCQNAIAQFTDQSTSAPGDPIISWNWDFGNGDNSTNQNPTSIYTATGSFNIDLQVATAFCSAGDTITIIVEPTPTASFTQNTISGCPILNVVFTNNSTGAVNYNWDFGDGSTSTLIEPTHNFTNNGTTDTTYTVTMIASTLFGCADTATQIITVFPAVSASFTHNGFPGCAPLTVDFINTSGPGATFVWDFGDGNGSVLTSPSHIYINSTLFIDVYTVQLIATSPNGCADTATQNITVFPLPDFSFSSVPDSGCSPLLVNFPSVLGAVQYNWDYGDGNTGTGLSPSHLYNNSTTNDVVYIVELIALSPFGCADTNYGTVTVFPNPTSQFIPSAISGCPDFPVTFENQSIGAINYYWDYNDGFLDSSAAAFHTHTFTNTTNGPLFYDVQLIVETDKGCTDTAIVQIEVFEPISASYTGDTAGCHPVNICFTNTSTNSIIWNWDFGDGIIDVVQSPCHTYTNLTNQETTFNVIMIATSADGCIDTATSTVLVYPIPNAVFTAVPVNQVFPDTNVVIANSSGGGSWNYGWDFGDGTFSTLQDPLAHDYSTWGSYTIELIVFSPYCADTAVQTVIIDPPLPILEFYGSDSGCFPVTVQFRDSSIYVDTYFWDFGDGGVSSLKDPLYTYNIPGTYSVMLTVTGPGGVIAGTKIDSVKVFPHAQAFFQYAPDEVFVPGTPVQFFNLSSIADTFSWDFGDGVITDIYEPTHFYQDEGTYTVTLIANNEWNCPDTHVVVDAILAKLGGEIQFPNAFTPDPNGSSGGAYDPNSFNNDVFFPIFEGVEDYHLMIFNRWGELIFESFDINIGWDGYYRDQLAQSDVYVWKVRARFTNGAEQTQIGELHLIR